MKETVQTIPLSCNELPGSSVSDLMLKFEFPSCSSSGRLVSATAVDIRSRVSKHVECRACTILVGVSRVCTHLYAVWCVP